MQYRFFEIPVFGDKQTEDALNAFLRTNRVTSIDKQLVQSPTNTAWCFCIGYVESGSYNVQSGNSSMNPDRKDYREILPPEEFKVFDILRKCRKEIALEMNVKPFMVFLDEHLAQMVKLPEITETSLKSLKGIGPGRIERLGQKFLSLYASKISETGNGDAAPTTDSTPEA